MRLTLFVPELIWPEPDDHAAFDALDCPALGALLARSRLMRGAPQPLETTLTDLFALHEGSQEDTHDLPFAAFRRLGEAGAPNDMPADTCWLCADPVHLRFHQERLILADSGSFGIELAEAQAIVDELNRCFGDVGVFHVASAERWYLQLAGNKELSDELSAQFSEFKVPPLSAIAGRRIDRQLPEGQQIAWLRKLLNEAQMVLHAHPINTARESAGRLPINSLWLWGAGILPPNLQSDFDGVWSTQPLALGLARAAGVATHPTPLDAATFFAHAAPESNHLVIAEDLLGPVQYQDVTAYRAALLALETRWFTPLRQALLGGQLTQLSLVSSTAYGTLNWQSRRIDQWKLWRRAQPLAQLAQHLVFN